ncbi:endolytic transglycosylase MltG [Streptomyces sp. NBC_01565]|uniref:endolytic transglycosylase MltG n=1 Tax=unclassified Streptomyces TaxID=2593676 RepID=UPI00225B8018|nr:endolytic transglycosylase MltG [Streptomyces sp. NBC_01565]MCX4544648.1 endolytic transglycosylase MltG [Streptomyces sp. NBC_01565]
MTEYGRGRGSEPWHPEDPLYGDQGWSGHEAQQGQVPYGGGAQQYQQAPQYQEPQYQQQPSYPQQGQQDPYVQQHQQYPGQQQGYAPQQFQEQQYRQEQLQEPQQQPQYQQQPQQQPTYAGQVWDTGQGAQVAAPADPYVAVDPYTQQPVGGYAGESPDLYTTPEAYPPPQPPGRRRPAPEPEAEEWQDDAEDAKNEDEPDSFFADRDDDDDDPDASGGGGRRSGRSKGKGGGKPKRRNGAACLIAAVVIIGVVGGGGYYGYTYLKARFGAAADYAGSGLDETVEVEIPKGAGLLQMGAILKEHGVVASAQAFANAAGSHPKGKSIQPGIYPLKKKMSGAAAVELMTDPSKLNVITVTEGMRNKAVYEAIDKKLSRPEGTTEETAKREIKNLGLPAWANSNQKIMDPLEGFLYPARYDLSKDSTPESLLKQMVKNANEKYAALGVEEKAKSLGLESPLQVITVASLVQAEGMNHDDFRKMSDVIYNRLKKSNDVTNQKLEFDSTINYLKGTSNINVSRAETKKLDHPYNTYFHKGLTPGPISNPGADALNATLDPDKGGWMFFVSVDGNKTTFTKTFAEHTKLVDEFNERQNQKQQNGG